MGAKQEPELTRIDAWQLASALQYHQHKDDPDWKPTEKDIENVFESANRFMAEEVWNTPANMKRLGDGYYFKGDREPCQICGNYGSHSVANNFAVCQAHHEWFHSWWDTEWEKFHPKEKET